MPEGLEKKKVAQLDLDQNQATPRERVHIAGVLFERDESGNWRYADNGIKVPGARDMKLSERYEHQLVVAPGSEEIIRVIINGQQVQAARADLGWCLDVGTPVRDEDGKLLEVLVPYSEWVARDRVPGAMIAPQHSNDPSDRALAEAEYSYRLAQLALDRATEHRVQVLQETAQAGMLRRRAADITGLTIGRIQQIVKPEALKPHQQTLLSILFKKESTAAQIAAEGRPGVSGKEKTVKQHLKALAKAGLVRQFQGGAWGLTEKGLKAHEVTQEEIQQLVGDKPPAPAPANEEPSPAEGELDVSGAGSA